MHLGRDMFTPEHAKRIAEFLGNGVSTRMVSSALDSGLYYDNLGQSRGNKTAVHFVTELTKLLCSPKYSHMSRQHYQEPLPDQLVEQLLADLSHIEWKGTEPPPVVVPVDKTLRRLCRVERLEE